MEEIEDDDNATIVQGTWVRKHGYVSECDIDARWILYYPNDDRPHGSLRIVSHPDLPPGHLRSFVSIVTKRWPKSPEELGKTLEQYGLLDNNELSYFNGVFYKKKIALTYYVYKGVIYQNKKYRKENQKTIVSYHDPIREAEIMSGGVKYRTPVNGDEFSVVTYTEPITQAELRHMFKSVASELEAYNVDEHVETWDTETMDKMRNLEKLYNIKIFG